MAENAIPERAVARARARSPTLLVRTVRTIDRHHHTTHVQCALSLVAGHKLLNALRIVSVQTTKTNKYDTVRFGADNEMRPSQNDCAELRREF